MIPGIIRPFGLATAGPSYSAQALAYFAAMSVQPDAARKTLINNLIVGLISDGVWAKLDWLVLLAAHNSQAGLLNAVTPSKILTNVNGVSFTTDLGYTGNGTSSYLSTGEVLNFSGANFSLNSATMGLYDNQDNGSGAAYGAGSLSLSGNNVLVSSDTGNYFGNINNNTNVTGNSTHRTGHFTVTRRASTDAEIYYNGASGGTNSTASSSISGGIAVICGAPVSGIYSPDRYAAYYTGGAFTDTDAANMNTRLVTYLTAIGAN